MKESLRERERRQCVFVCELVLLLYEWPFLLIFKNHFRQRFSDSGFEVIMVVLGFIHPYHDVLLVWWMWFSLLMFVYLPLWIWPARVLVYVVVSDCGLFRPDLFCLVLICWMTCISIIVFVFTLLLLLFVCYVLFLEIVRSSPFVFILNFDSMFSICGSVSWFWGKCFNFFFSY